MAAPTNTLSEGRRGERCSPAVISDFRLQATILCRDVGGGVPNAPRPATKSAVGMQGRLLTTRASAERCNNTAALREPSPNPLPHFKAYIIQDFIMREGENCSGAGAPERLPPYIRRPAAGCRGRRPATKSAMGM